MWCNVRLTDLQILLSSPDIAAKQLSLVGTFSMTMLFAIEAPNLCLLKVSSSLKPRSFREKISIHNTVIYTEADNTAVHKAPQHSTLSDCTERIVTDMRNRKVSDTGLTKDTLELCAGQPPCNTNVGTVAKA